MLLNEEDSVNIKTWYLQDCGNLEQFTSSWWMNTKYDNRRSLKFES